MKKTAYCAPDVTFFSMTSFDDILLDSTDKEFSIDAEGLFGDPTPDVDINIDTLFN